MGGGMDGGKNGKDGLSEGWSSELVTTRGVLAGGDDSGGPLLLVVLAMCHSGETPAMGASCCLPALPAPRRPPRPRSSRTGKVSPA